MHEQSIPALSKRSWFVQLSGSYHLPIPCSVMDPEPWIVVALQIVTTHLFIFKSLFFFVVVVSMFLHAIYVSYGAHRAQKKAGTLELKLEAVVIHQTLVLVAKWVLWERAISVLKD